MRKALALATAVGLAVCMALVVAAPAMAETGAIRGKVVDAEEGEGQSEVEVCAESVPPQPVEPPCVETEEGRYEIPGLEVGGYRVHFEPLNAERGFLPQYFLHTMLKSAARVVEVQEEGEVKNGIGAALEKPGWVTGTVTDLNGFALSEIEVCASAKLLPELEPFCAETDVAGKYRIDFLPPGPYTAYFSAPESPDVFPQYYGGGESAEEAEDFFVFGYNETAGIDAQMEIGSTIGGEVDEAGSGAALKGIRVCVLDAVSGVEVRCVATAADGSYSFSGLHSGIYVVGFSVTDEKGGLPVLSQEDGYVRQYFDGQSSFGGAEPLNATQPSLYDEVDADLVKGPEVFPRPSDGSGGSGGGESGDASGSGASTSSSPPPAATPPAPVPKPRLHCRKHFRAKTVNGKRRCVKVQKRHRHRHDGRP
jgi:hypothetical protein